jgi:hypothetical protein
MVGALLFARDQKSGQTRYKTANPSLANGPALTTLNINNIEVWVRRDAALPPDGANGASADYPKGITNLIYAEGMVWGVRVYDGTEPILRVGGSTYASGMKAGKILGTDGNHWQPGTMPGGSEISGDRHVWRVRTDFKSVNLAADAASFFQGTTASVGEIAEVFAQYEYDWLNWPADEGAPFDDLDEDGVYTPATWNATTSTWVNGDIPGEPGADQTLWTVANDLPYADTGGEVAPNAYGSPGIGIEEQLTVWGYNFPASNPLGNIQFKRARMIYTGRIDGNTDSHVDTAYFSQWSDPDLGTFTDDYVGFDLDLSLGYVYNGNTLDATYNGVYGMAVPAGGYDFLQSPKVDGVELGMTTTGWFGAGSNDTDPDLEEYGGTLQWWNLLEGYRPRPDFPERLPWINNVTLEETKTPLAGDPVTGVGDIDGIVLGPGDRRLLMNSGPFTIALGDTQDVVIALIGALGGDNLSSITVLKYYDIAAQYAYDNEFSLPSAPAAPFVQSTARDKQIILDWGNNKEAVAATEEVIQKGFEFQGYKVYQLPSAGATANEGTQIAIFDVIDGVGTIIEPAVDPNTGFLLDLPIHIGTNEGISRYLEINEDRLKFRPLSNDIDYYFGVSAYSYLEDNATSPFKSLESSMSRITVRPTKPAAGVVIPTEFGDDIDMTHIGTAGGIVTGTIIDPMAVTGHDYKVWFDQAHYYLDYDFNWKPTAEPGVIAKLLDISPSTVTGTAVTDNAGYALIFELDIVSSDYDCAQGALIGIPGSVITAVSAPDGVAFQIQPDGSSVLFGSVSPDGGGPFCGGDIVSISVDENTVTLPIGFTWKLYDDAWATLRCDPDGDGIVDPADVDYCAHYGLGPGYSVVADAEGTGTITDVGLAFTTVNQWNLDDVTSGETLIAGSSVFDETDYPPENPGGIDVGLFGTPTYDGMQVYVDVGFAAPLDFETATFADGSDVCLGTNAVSSNDCDIMVDSYEYSGWAAGDAWAVNTYGDGITAINDLQCDIKVVFDGVYGDPIPTGFGGSYIPVVEGGSMAWLYQGSDLAIHPENPNPGTDAEFLLRVPFTIWNVEDPDNVYQMGMIMRDRIQPYDGSDPDLYGFNIQDRMYTYMIHRPYEETLNDFASNEAFLSWNHVWWRTLFEVGQEITFAYANPIQHGVDEWVFSPAAPTSGGDITADMVDMINVFPNPYYGFQALETTRRGKFVRFNHLPQKADIRIFNMGGVMVRKIEKDDDTQNADWDLTNQYSLPVASGIYIAHIDLPDVGKEKILKIALIQEEQILLSY